MIAIKPIRPAAHVVNVPGSKSYSHRTLIAAALADGPCRVRHALDSDDIRLTRQALTDVGISFDGDFDDLAVSGNGGRLAPCPAPIYLANSGTSMRLLTAVVALGQGVYTLTGTDRMHQRPIGHLLEALQQLGVDAFAINGDDCPPLSIAGGQIEGGRVEIDCSISSQYLSALMLTAPCTEKGMQITVSRGPVSRPYIDMTVDVLERFGIDLQRTGYQRFDIPGRQVYAAGDYVVEPDCSQAGYFWAAAAISGQSITVSGIDRHSRQGDVGFVDVLARMGCTIEDVSDGIRVTGGALQGVDVDMGNMPDLVPTLAVVAAFAKGETIARNVGHLRAKESDRLAAVAAELTKMGIRVECGPDHIAIEGGTPHGAEIETYDDHRIAMSFAVAGLMVPGVQVRDPGCVAKSFPNFWDVLSTIQEC